MRPIILVPVLHRGQAESMLATLADDLLPYVVAVDQTMSGLGAGWPRVVRPEEHTHERNYRPRRNIGVARCMNLAARSVLDYEADAVLWVSTSMRFADDGGHAILDRAEPEPLGLIGLPAALHAFVIKRLAFEVVGLWDENFGFGYHEDTDWRYRLSLVAEPLPVVDLPGRHERDGRAYDVLRSLNPGRMVVNFDAQKAYYVDKWGGLPGEEIYTSPFGMGCRIDYWEPCTREEIIERHGLGL